MRRGGQTFECKDLEYTVNADGTTVSVAAQGEAVSGNVVIPGTVEHDGKTYSVTSIGKYAFLYCSSLTSIEIPSSVTSIGQYAFEGCSGLTSIEIPEGVKTIGEGAFGHCSSLTSVTIPSSVTSIGNYAFLKCSALTSIEIPEGVETIGGGAFSDCYKLGKISIPKSVQTIGPTIFAKCGPIAVAYGGSQEKWDSFHVELPVGSPKVLCDAKTVQFDPNGHGTAPENVYVKDGETIAEADCPTLSEIGYTFKGWYYTENETENEFVFGENGTPVTSSMTLKAKWSPISYQLTVDGSAESHDYDEKVTVDEPTKEGYTFAGWTVETENVTPTKGDDGKWSFKMPAGNVTLKAKWEINQYTVTFNANGYGQNTTKPVQYGKTVTAQTIRQQRAIFLPAGTKTKMEPEKCLIRTAR